jgi:hypothetical protein
MPVLMCVKWAEVTPASYDQTLELINWEANPPPGLLCHIATLDDGAITVYDLWESPEQFRAWVEGRLRPMIDQIGVPGEPSIEMLTTHNVFIP